jgi:hypothetical protein
LVGLLVEVRVNVAVRLEAVVEVAPQVDHVVAVGVGKPPQRLSIAVADDPGGGAVLFLGANRALGDFLLCRLAVGAVWLDRFEGQCLLLGGSARGIARASQVLKTAEAHCDCRVLKSCSVHPTCSS